MNRIESKTQVTTTTEVDCSLNETYSLSFKGRKDDKGEISFISNGSILDEYGKTIGTIRFTNYGSKELTVTAPLDVAGVVTPLIVDAINQVNGGNHTEVETFSRVFKSHKASTNEEQTESAEEVITPLPPTNELSSNQMKDIMGLPHEPDGGEETVFENAESESDTAETEDSVGADSETAETEDSAN